MASSRHKVDLLPSLLQSTAIAYRTLGNSILALDQLGKVTVVIEAVVSSLKQENERYDDLIKSLSRLATQYKKLDIETKSHVRTVKEQAKENERIIEDAKNKLLNGKSISEHFMEIEGTVNESLTSSETLRKRYDIIINQVKDSCSQAKAGWERNEHKADLAEKGLSIGFLGGLGVGGAFVAFQVATRALCVLGPPGAVAGGVLGLVGGGIMGGMAGGLPFATAEALFRKYAEKFKILDETLSQVDDILLENFEVMTEICRLLGKLTKLSKNLAFNVMVESDESLIKEELKSDDVIASSDDMNIDFLIQVKFDLFKNACKKLEKNCDYLLNDIPLKEVPLRLKDEEIMEKRKMK